MMGWTAAVLAGGCQTSDDVPAAAPKILAWPDGKSAAFTLSFDDGCESQVANVFPLLLQYRIHGTFYVCPSWPSFAKNEALWGTDNPYVTLGNHSFSHGKIADPAALEKELADCNAAIRRIEKGRPWPRLIAFGIPGTETVQGLCEITDAEANSIYARNNLVVRAPYYGYPVNCKDVRAMETYVDSVVAGGGFGHLDFHGVGGDWLDPGLPYFKSVMNKLNAVRESLWFAPYVEIHKYMRLRDEATIAQTVRSDGTVVLEVRSALDPKLYDIPLSVRIETSARPRIVRAGIGQTEIRP